MYFLKLSSLSLASILLALSCGSAEACEKDYVVVLGLDQCMPSEELAAMVADKNVETCAVIAVHAYDGAMPATRESVLFALENDIEVTGAILEGQQSVDDEELMKLVEMELRELVGSYQKSGDFNSIYWTERHYTETKNTCFFKRLDFTSEMNNLAVN